MLRTAVSSKSYDVTVNIAGEQTKMVFRSLTLMERLEFIETIAVVALNSDDVAQLATDLEQLIVSIEGHDGAPSEVLRRLEHKSDLDELLVQIYKWCHLPEQESKNLDSLPAQSTPAPVEENAEKTAGAESDPVSTNEIDSAKTEVSP